MVDDGPGIEPAELKRIFGRFEQATHNGTKQSSGVGLGLNIAQKLAALNFGSIDVDSEVGQGTVFRLSLPLPDPACIATRMAESRTSGVGPVCLLALDIPGIQDQRQSDDFERFICGSFRVEDLLFRQTNDRWLLLFSGNQQDAKLWMERTESDFEQMNRNRPFGSLPNYVATFFECSGRDDIESVRDVLREEWNRTMEMVPSLGR